MKPADLRELDLEEIQARIADWEEQLFRYRCDKKIGQLENTNLLRKTRRDIARAKTIMGEKQDAASQAE